MQVGISLTAGKVSVGRLQSPQERGVKALMLHRSYRRERDEQKDRESARNERGRDWSEGDLGLLLLEALQNVGSRCLMFFLIAAPELRRRI